MNPLPRRRFLQSSLAAGAAWSLARSAAAAASEAAPSRGGGDGAPPGIVDTNVNLFDWPFRRLKYRETGALVAKLRRHRIVEAWAGSYEALLHKDMSGVNERLASACREKGGGLLRPFGAINLAWPDWEEEVRRCHEIWRMPGLRLFPGYQPYDLEHPDLSRLLHVARERGLLLQVVFAMEDPRVHHPVLALRPVLPGPLVKALAAVPGARVQLLHFAGNVQGTDLRQIVADTEAAFDFSRWESNGMVGRMIGAAPGDRRVRVPVERVLFGSHAPYFPVETAILKLIESPLDAAQLGAIMQGNARRLLPPA